MAQVPTNPNVDYGKRPLWQWVVIYAVIALVAYGLIYYFFLAKNGNNNGQTNIYQSPTSVPTSEITPTSVENNPTTTPAISQNLVTLTSSGFSPSTLTIKTGETVTWINQSGQEGAIYSNPHPLRTNYPPLNLGTFTNGATLSLTFPTPGTYGYHNHLNPSQLGTIIVK